MYAYCLCITNIVTVMIEERKRVQGLTCWAPVIALNRARSFNSFPYMLEWTTFIFILMYIYCTDQVASDSKKVGHLLNPTQDHISNYHHHGFKIKYQSISILWTTPLHFAASRGHLAKLGAFCLPVGININN